MASKHCSLLHLVRCGEQTTRCGELWQVSVGKCDFSPQNPIFIQPNPKFDRKLNLWWFYNLNIYYTQFYGLSALINNQILHVLRSILVSNPNPQIHKNNNKRLENVSLTLTLDWWFARLYKFSLLLVLFSSFSQILFVKPNLCLTLAFLYILTAFLLNTT